MSTDFKSFSYNRATMGAPPSYDQSSAAPSNPFADQRDYNDHDDQDAYPAPLRTRTNQTMLAPPPVTRGKKSIGDHFHKITTMAGMPLNKAANLVGAEGWWPSGMEKECNKAARILYSFTKIGAAPPKKSGPMHPIGITRKSITTIPQQVLQNCSGLAIFNVLRAGVYMGSLAAGSGVVVARRPDGTWSPPSAFVLSTVGAGFMLGLDIYDCVIVLNTPSQLRAFTHPRVSLGGELSIALGPVGTGAAVEAAVSKTVRPMYSYMKSRGLWAGIQVDGTVMVTRPDANGIFYGDKKITAKRILTTSEVPWPAGGQALFQVLQSIEGKSGLDAGVIHEVSNQPTPGDLPRDPYDVYATEKGVSVGAGDAYSYGEHDEENDAIAEKRRLRAAGW